MEEIVIVSAFRSAIGSFLGSLSTLPVHELSKPLITHSLKHTGVTAENISEVILGHVLSSGCGQNAARQASIAAGIPVSVPAWSVNKVCGSGLMSVILGYNSIRMGQANIVLAGGHESMSQTPHGLNIRHAGKMGPATAEDLMVKDGLTDAFSNIHMGLTAEAIAEKFKITREEQDEFSLSSQLKAGAAKKAGRFENEIVPITVTSRKGAVIFSEDEYVRDNIDIEAMRKLRPAFKKDGTVTAGNSSGINDAAAIVMLMTKTEAQKRGLPIMGRIASFASSGVEPMLMGTGPIPASNKALEIAGWKASDLDLIEANEAFAAQAICVNRSMGWDLDRVNVNGGAIALGHPIGASGARILVTLLHEMTARNAHKGLATLCIGGGMGVAMCIER